MDLKRIRVWGATAALVVGGASSLLAQSTNIDDRVKELEAQNRAIIERLNAAETRNVVLEDEVKRLKEAPTVEISEKLEKMINSIEFAEGEALTWKDVVKSGFSLRFYGNLTFHAYWNEARLDNAVSPLTVVPENGTSVDGNDDQFAFDARLTRFGFDVNAGQIGDAKVTGKLEIDFSNFPTGPSESRETPRMRLAYTDLDFGAFGLRFGQDWDVISPLMPSVDQQNLLWNSGNLGDRRPQAIVRWKTGDPKDFAFEARASAGLTGAIDNRDADAVVAGVSSERDGFDSGHPHAQLRLGIQTPSWAEGKTIAAGIWGYWGSFETDTQFDGEDDFDAWTIGLDLSLPIFSCLTLRGEGWIGSALGDMRGSVGQTFATNGTNNGDEVDAFGGWAELVFNATDTWTLHIGAAADNPDDDDVNRNAANFSTDGKTLNWTGYVGTVYDFGGGFRAGFDVLYRETQYMETGIGNGIRLDFWTMLTF